MKISIIIPIYKVEQCLSKCLDSVYQKGVDEKNFEVVCVNDGTPDNSMAIVNKYALEHTNIVVVTQKNQGVSVARNSGMKAATGEYILFADSDDRLSDLSIGTLLEALQNVPDAEMVVCNHFRNGGYAYDWRRLGFKENIVYDGTMVLNGGLLYGSVMGVVFKKAFLNDNNIMFMPGIKNGEDTIFMLQAFFCAQKVRFLNRDLYVVVGRAGSASRLFTKSRIDTMIETVKRVSAFRETLLHQSGNRMVLDYMIYIVLLNLVKDTFLTPGVGYNYLRRAGVGRFCKFGLSPDTHFLRRKMQLMRLSFSLFYFVRKLSVMLRKA